MSKLKIRVTSNCLAQVKAAGASGPNQRQIAATDLSQDIVDARNSATGDIPIALGGHWTLMLGDTYAFWPSHQLTEKQQSAFEHLYGLLSLHPDTALTLEW